MPSQSSLALAYESALYVAGDVVIRIGHAPVPPIEREWAFITAHNPGSRRLSRNANKRRHRALLRALSEAGVAAADVVDGESRAPDGQWRERSVLVLGLARADACALGRRFGQRAVVVGAAGGVARLEWLR